MPFYTCIHKAGIVSEESKRAIAVGITDIHCGLTGAPRHFVHVMFQDYKSGNCYSGGEDSRVANIRGSVRAGRSQETKEKMMEQMTALWRKECPETTLGDIVVSLAEVPATNVMEGGVLLPHPKDDAAWLVSNGFSAAGVSETV
jgi:phenylpyruvate tautomerase PptA (4-oxalocrotonate tautomerase family)